mgnify:CR=1 FL=1
MRDTIIEIIMHIRAAWRYRWYAMMFAWLVAISGWAVLFIVPDRYESSARVYVDTDSMLRPLLQGLAVQTDIGQRLRLMSKTLLSRPNLETVTRVTDLDLTAGTIEEKERLLLDLEKDIKLKSAGKQNLYTITYQNKDPKMAKNVVQALLTIFVETSLGNTRQDSDSVQRFLNKKIKEYETLLIEAENKLTDFKRKHVGTLPGQDGGIFGQLQQTDTNLKTSELAYREALQRRNELKKQLGIASKNIASGSVKNVSPLDARILLLQKKLDQLLLRFTEEHPDVKEIKETIVELEKQKTGKTGNKKEVVIAQNVLLEQLHLELGKAEANLAASRVRVSTFRSRLTKLKLLVETLPKVETELKRLNRDYSINKKNYDALLQRRESARMSDSADASGDTVKFRIVDPPRLPIIPASPKRSLLTATILIVSIGLGGGLAFLLSQLQPVILESNGLRKLTGYPVFGSVSRVWTPELLFKRKLEVTAYVVVAFSLFVVCLGVFLVNIYATDVQWIKDLRGSQ